MHLLTALLLCLPLQVTSVTPSEGSFGTLLSIDGTGFGSKPPAVALVDPSTGKKTALKVLAHGDTHVEALLKKAAKAGPRDLRLVPKGGAALLFADAFVLREPEPQQLDAPVAFPGDERSLSGRFFGDRKGKLRVGGVNAKVLAWADDGVTFVVPKKAAGGVRDVSISNAAGEGLLPSALVVQGAAMGDGPDVLILALGDETLTAVDPWQVLGVEGNGLHFAAAFGQGRSLHVQLPVDLSVQPLALSVINDPAGHVAFHDGAPLLDADATLWTTQGQGDTYHVNLWEGGVHRVVGTVTGTLPRASGGQEPAVLSIEMGIFLLTLPDAP